MVERTFGQKLWDILGSRDLSVVIFVASLTYTLFLVVFGMVVPLPWVNNISKLLPFKVLYLLFFVNLIICEIKWIPVVIKRCEVLTPPDIATDLERFRHRVEVRGSELNVQSLARYLRRRGYYVEGKSSTLKNLDSESFSPNAHYPSLLLYAHRGRFSSIGNLFFHIGFLFLFVGVVSSLLLRFEGDLRLPEGYGFSGKANEYTFISAAPFSSIPNLSFLLNKIYPEFWEGKLLFTGLKGEVQYEDGTGSIFLSSALRISGARVTLKNIGLTPMYVLKNKEGNEIDAADVNLAIFVPGTEDHFLMPGFPHQIFVAFYPDYDVVDGKILNRSMHIKNPVYAVKIFRGRIPVYSGFIKPGEEALFEGLRLSFPEMRYWGEFKIVKDPGFPFIWTAFILFVTGLVWRLVFYKREVVVIRKADEVYLYGNSDYYHRLFENRLMMLAEIKFER